jgi:tetratricopeptide (TPR) repeat protein
MIRTRVEDISVGSKRDRSDISHLIDTGHEKLGKGDYKGARQKFRLALLYDPRVAAKISLFYENILESENGNINARLSLADIHLILGEVEGAIGELEEILDVAPERTDIYNILGKLHIRQKDFDSAIHVIESAFKANVKDTGLVEMLAGAYVEKDRIQDAIALYKNLTSDVRTNKNFLRTLAQLYARVGQIDDAATSYLSMVGTDPTLANEAMYKLEELKEGHGGNLHLKEVLADVYIKLIKPSQAAQELEEVIKADPSYLDKGIKKYREILDKYPDEPSTLKALARALTKKELFSEAVSEYVRLMRFSNEFIEDSIAGFNDILTKYPDQVHAHESLGDAYLRLNKIEDALIEYLKVLKLNGSAAKTIINKCIKISKENPNLMLTHQVLGTCYLLEKHGTSALQEAEFMIYLDKNHAPAYEIMGDSYLLMGNAAKAQGAYSSAMAVEPFSVSLHKKYAGASLKILKDDIEVLKKRIDEDPWRLGNHLDIAKLYLHEGDFEKGIKELQAAVKDSARAPFAYNLLGSTFIEMGRFDLAASQFERALESTPKELSDIAKTIRFNLGASYEAMGSVAAAISQYEMVLSEDVEFSGLQGRISNLSRVNNDSLRNKLIVGLIEHLGSENVIGLWGQDVRHSETTDELMNLSFGQEHNNSGFDHFIKGRLKNAVEEFSLAVQLDPRFASALNNLAIVLMKQGALEQAQTRLQFAMSLDADSAVLYNNLGIFNFMKKDYDSAVAAFNKALEIDPNLSAAYINLGDLMYLKGQAQSAISLWSKVRTNDPLSPIASRRLAYKTIRT